MIKTSNNIIICKKCDNIINDVSLSFSMDETGIHNEDNKNEIICNKCGTIYELSNVIIKPLFSIKEIDIDKIPDTFSYTIPNISIIYRAKYIQSSDRYEVSWITSNGVYKLSYPPKIVRKFIELKSWRII